MAKNRMTVTISDNIKPQISELTERQVIEAIAVSTTDNFFKDLKVDWNLLKEQARIFLSAIITLDKNYSTYRRETLKRVVSNPNIASYINQSSFSKERYYAQSLYLLAFNFERYLNNFREEDKKRSTLYIFNDGKGNVETYEMDYRELIYNADKHGRIQGFAKARLTNEDRKAVEQRKGFFDDKHLAEAEAAYKGTYNRWLRYFEVTRKSGQKQNGLIMWKEQKRWMIGNLINTGDLKEAYAAFLFEEHGKNNLCGMDFGQPEYYNHEFIGTFFNNYINKVTNLEAVIEEDVITDSVQYGVKGKQSSLPSLKQFITVAELILSTDNVLSKEELEEAIRKKFNVGDETKGRRNFKMTAKEALEKGVISNAEFKKLTK